MFVPASVASTPPIHFSAEAVLAACDVPLTSWRSQLQRLRQRLEAELTRIGEAVYLSKWWNNPHSYGDTTADLMPREQDALRSQARMNPTQTHELLRISLAELASCTLEQISDRLQQAVRLMQHNRNQTRQRISTDQPALMLLEAEGVAADCVGIVAQYVNSDFQQQPYVSAYKQQ